MSGPTILLTLSNSCDLAEKPASSNPFYWLLFMNSLSNFWHLWSTLEQTFQFYALLCGIFFMHIHTHVHTHKTYVGIAITYVKRFYDLRCAFFHSPDTGKFYDILLIVTFNVHSVKHLLQNIKLDKSNWKLNVIQLLLWVSVYYSL